MLKWSTRVSDELYMNSTGRLKLKLCSPLSLRSRLRRRQSRPRSPTMQSTPHPKLCRTGNFAIPHAGRSSRRVVNSARQSWTVSAIINQRSTAVDHRSTYDDTTCGGRPRRPLPFSTPSVHFVNSTVRACLSVRPSTRDGTGSHFVTQRPSDPGIQRPGETS